MKKSPKLEGMKRRLHHLIEKIQEKRRKETGKRCGNVDFYFLYGFDPSLDPSNASDRKAASTAVSAWTDPGQGSRPTWEEWAMICEKLGVSMDYFLFGEGNSTPAPGSSGGKFDDLTERDIGQLLFVELPRRFECRYKDGFDVYEMNGDIPNCVDTIGGVTVEINTSHFVALSKCARAVAAFNNSNLDLEFINTALEGAIGLLPRNKKIPIRNGANGVKSGVKEE